MILVLDNYDSFTYNLVQVLGELGAEVEVRRDDQVTSQGEGASTGLRNKGTSRRIYGHGKGPRSGLGYICANAVCRVAKRIRPGGYDGTLIPVQRRKGGPAYGGYTICYRRCGELRMAK